MAKVINACVFCTKKHRVIPKLCRARALVVKDLTKDTPEATVMSRIRSGAIDLDWAAQRRMKRMR
jgi:hypothetical protein